MQPHTEVGIVALLTMSLNVTPKNLAKSRALGRVVNGFCNSVEEADDFFHYFSVFNRDRYHLKLLGLTIS